MKNSLLTGIILSAILTASVSGAQFNKTKTYAGEFTDVSQTEWYAQEVISTYELGFMNGVGAGLFNPDGNVTRAEAITMAARVCAAYNGETIPSAEGEWYTQYVNYAVAKGFLTPDRFTVLDVPATRAEVAELFAKALPAAEYVQKNTVDKIPDVGTHLDYYDEVLSLYKAGIVMGSDAYGNFRPEDNIIRAEAAAILNRVALPEKRLAKTLDKMSDDDAYLLIINNSMTGGYEGISSGWVLDNRGGSPKKELKSGYGALTDIRDDAGTAYIRGINKTSTGLLTFHTSVQLNGNGGYMEYRNDADKSVYRVEAMDNKWQLLNADGSYTALADITEEDKAYVFRMVLDLDNNRATTYIDNVNCGTYPLITSGADTNILNFRYGTTDEAKVTLSPGGLLATANYAVYDFFDIYTESGVMPFGWYGYNALSEENVLKVKAGGNAVKAFTPVSGKAVVESWYLSSDVPAGFDVMSGSKKILEFKTDTDNFYVNGNKVYENYYNDIWYRLRFELDTETGLADIKVNGRYVAKDIAFGNKTTSVDTISVTNGGTGDVLFDNFKVFREIEHDDYVPVPVPLEDEYNIGMNVCSLWQNGTHGGWSCITPYDDKQPVLGYYDEGNTETADWEIKYLLEHGVDFQAFCFFFTYDYPFRPANAMHLFDGYMNAKYSDMSKYCMLWEVGNGQSPRSLDEWKEKYVPYIVENFLKDERYMTIDNKPVIYVFGVSALDSRNGGQTKAMFDYLEEVAIGMGFDGMIYLATADPSEAVANMGFDGTYAYSWSRAGYQLAVNKDRNINNAKKAEELNIYQVPTVSVGFNDIGWNPERYPLITGEDYKAAHEWVRDTYLTTYPKEEWQKNLVMLSTWNEYGEGTYIMPTADKSGFMYLDSVREVYGGNVDEKLNTVPTDAQLYRITHLYPQYQRLLRKQGYYNSEIREDEISVLSSFHFGKDEFGENVINQGIDGKQTENGFAGKSSYDDPKLIINKMPGNVNTKNVAAIRFTVDIPADSNFEFFYTTSDFPAYVQGNSRAIKTTKSGLQEITFLARDFKNFTGDLLGLRVDPCTTTDTEMVIVSVEVLGYTVEELEKEITVNGNESTLYFAPRVAANGDILTAFDAASGLDFKLALYYTWDAEGKVLTLMSKDHTAVFTVGKNSYTVDGTVKNLDYEIEFQDGLPLIPINKLCEDFGYEFEVKDERININTFELEYYEDVKASNVEGQWNFNFNGETEGWKSSDLTLTVADGYMRCTNSSGSGDPKIQYGGELGFEAKKYKACEYKVRYDYVSEKPQGMMIYFTTEKHPGLSEHSKIYAKHERTTTDGKWVTYTVDLTAISNWDGKVTSMRFDPFDVTSGTLDVDYIRLIPDENYVAEEEDDANLSENDIEKWIADNSYYWDFDSDDYYQNWTTGHFNTAVKDGFLSLKSKDFHDDPNISFKDEATILDAAKYNKLEIKVRYKYEAKEPSIMQMFFTTDLDPALSESKAYVIPLKSIDTKGEWETYTVDLTKKSLWNGQITFLRLDPFNSYGEMDIDYIKLVANPEYAGPEISGQPSAPKESTFSGISNGDAESAGGFIGQTQGKFEIVTDPDNPGNYCFKNVPLSDNEMWLYTSQYCTFTTGGKYKVKVDVRLASHGTDENIPADFEAVLCFNAQYDGKDHVLSRLPLKASDGWKTFEFEFSIDASSKSRDYDNFCFYSNPVGGKGVGYYLDNIEVVEIG